MFIKIFLFFFIFAILDVLREGFLFYRALSKGESNMTTPRRIGLGASIAYILTIIITGFGL